MTGIEELDTRQLYEENKELKRTLNALLDAIDADSNNGIDTTPARDDMPPLPGQANPITPIWERQGFDSKQAWLDNVKSDGGQPVPDGGSPGQGNGGGA